MICTQCGVDNPDVAIFCQSCGRRFEREENTPAIPFEQLSFTEQPTLVQQPDVPEQTLPASDAQHWETFGPTIPPDQGPPPYESFPVMAQVPVSETNLAPNVGMVSTPPPVVPEPRSNMLAKALPLWATLIGTVIVVLILAVLQYTGTDWAAGAMHVAIVAGSIGLALLLVMGVRALAGMRRVSQFISAGLAIFLLLVLSGAGFTQQSFLHRLQGNSFEGQKLWQQSITEYQFAGETAPTSVDIARTYTEWGEQFATSQQYEAAIGKFDTVLDSFGSAPIEVARAQSDKVEVYIAWGKQAVQQQDYTTATTRFNDLLNLSYCNANCQDQANALDATAYYAQAKKDIGAQQYTDAITTFQLILSRFPHSTEAQQIHPVYAQALFGQGKQLMAISCSSAIPTYQELSTKYADTPEGQQAKSALLAPESVKGRFTGSVIRGPGITPLVVLAQKITPSTFQSQFFNVYNSSPNAPVQSNGSFSFKPLPQGSYILVWGVNDSNGRNFRTYDNGSTFLYIATVGPLCPFDFGNINESFPAAL